MERYSKVLSILAAALAACLLVPGAAAAGCPGCEEYTLDIPQNDGSDTADPAPATGVPAPVAPAAAPPSTETAPVPTETAVPTTSESAAPDRAPVRKPRDTDPDPVPVEAAEPPRARAIPAITATRASEAGDPAGGATGGVLPLAIALAAVAAVGAALGLRRRREPAPAPPA